MLRLVIAIAVAAPLLSGCIVISTEKPTTRVVTARLQHERTRLAALRARPVLADAGGVLRAQRELVDELVSNLKPGGAIVIFDRTATFNGYLSQVVNRLTLDEYLRGVVPNEMPAWFPPQALRAATDAFQLQLIEQTLAAQDGNWAATARALELDSGNLHRLARRLGLKD